MGRGHLKGQSDSIRIKGGSDEFWFHSTEDMFVSFGGQLTMEGLITKCGIVTSLFSFPCLISVRLATCWLLSYCQLRNQNMMNGLRS